MLSIQQNAFSAASFHDPYAAAPDGHRTDILYCWKFNQSFRFRVGRRCVLRRMHYKPKDEPVFCFMAMFGRKPLLE